MSRLRTELVVIAFAVGCGPDRTAPPAPAPAPPSAPAPSPPPPTVQWYRAAVGHPPDEVPFFMGVLDRASGGSGAPATCIIANGRERLEFPCAWPDPDAFDLEFSEFRAAIRAKRSAGGLVGLWYRWPSEGLGPLEFSATPIPGLDPELRFGSADVATGSGSGSAVDFTGTWQFAFEASGAGKGVFTQAPDGVVEGTIIAKDIGDMRYLAGTARGGSLALSTFDGQHAYVLHATLRPNGVLTGRWMYPEILDDAFTAKHVERVDEATLESLRLKPGKTRVTIPELSDPAYAGKPLLVDFSGSWCPACIDEAPFLVDLYKRFHSQGLEILTISLEATTDKAVGEKQIAFIRDHFQIPWHIQLRSGDVTDLLAEMPPELENTGGLPLTLFIARDGTVRDLHSGFYGPAAPEDNRKLVARFEADVRAILASPAPPAAGSASPSGAGSGS